MISLHTVNGTRLLYIKVGEDGGTFGISANDEVVCPVHHWPGIVQLFRDAGARETLEGHLVATLQELRGL
jgi:hypothetical protein